MFGYLGTVQSGMEFVMYMVIPLLVNSIGAKRGLLIVGLVVGARLIISGLCDSHLLISVLKPLYGRKYVCCWYRSLNILLSISINALTPPCICWAIRPCSTWATWLSLRLPLSV